MPVFDSTGHFPIGLAVGTHSSLGDFDECIEVKSGTDIKHQFVGQYCVPKFQLPFDFNIEYSNDTFYYKSLPALKRIMPLISNAFCIPSTCSPKDFKYILTKSKKKKL